MICAAALRHSEGMTGITVACACSASSATSGDAWIAAGSRMSSGCAGKQDSEFHPFRPFWLTCAMRSPEADAIFMPTMRSGLPTGRTCGSISITFARDVIGATVPRPCGSLQGGTGGEADFL